MYAKFVHGLHNDHSQNIWPFSARCTRYFTILEKEIFFRLPVWTKSLEEKEDRKQLNYKENNKHTPMKRVILFAAP